MTMHPATVRRCLALCLGVLVALGLIEYATYPDVSWRISEVVGGGEADGSTMRYFLDVYVLPGLGAFTLIAAAGLALAARKSHRALHAAFVVVLLLNAALLFSSSVWYYRGIAAATAATTPSPSLASEMKRLSVRSALIVASPSVDEPPLVWPPDGRHVAFRSDGRWHWVALAPVTLVAATGMGSEPIGRAEPKPATPSVSESVVKEWERQGAFGNQKATGRDGTTAELKMTESGTALVVTRPNSPPETVWSSKIESCHSPSLSPDQRWVAYICEQEGLIVTEL